MQKGALHTFLCGAGALVGGFALTLIGGGKGEEAAGKRQTRKCENAKHDACEDEEGKHLPLGGKTHMIEEVKRPLHGLGNITDDGQQLGK